MTVHPQSILLDAEALSSLAGAERRMQAWAEVARRTDSVLYASTATLPEVTDGTPRDAPVRHATKALVRLLDVDPATGYLAGAMRAAAKGHRKARDLTVDALVAATATGLRSPTVVLTSDPDDLQLLLTDHDVKVEAV